MIELVGYNKKQLIYKKLRYLLLSTDFWHNVTLLNKLSCFQAQLLDT